MAEEIRRRIAALRWAAALAVALTIAGFTTRDTPALMGASDSRVGPNTIGSEQVKNHTLLSKDFKAGQVLTPRQADNQYLKIEEAAASFYKLSDGLANKNQIADLFQKFADLPNTFLKIDDAAASYYKLSDGLANKNQIAELFDKFAELPNTFLKISAFDAYKVEIADKLLKVDAYKLGGLSPEAYLKGDGSVVTGLEIIEGAGSAPVLHLEGLMSVAAVNGNEAQNFVVTNLSSDEPLWFSWGSESQTIEPKGSAGILIGLNQPTLAQAFLGDGKMLTTLTLNEISHAKGSLFTAQAVVSGR